MASKVQTEIDSIDKSIGTLLTRIQNLKKELESGNWGTGQLAEFQSKLDKLNQTLSKKSAKRESLVSKQETQELNSLNKSIDTLNKKIAERNAVLAGPRNNGNDFYTKMEKDVRNAEKALASLESRRQKRFDPVSGARLTEQQIQQKQLPIVQMPKDDIERRLNKSVLGINSTNSEIAAQIAKARKIALDVIQGRIKFEATPGAKEAGQGGYRFGTPAGPAPDPNVPLGTGMNLPLSTSAKSSADSNKSLEAKARVDKKRKDIAEREAAEEQKLADLRRRIATEPAFRNYLQQLKTRGLGINDITSGVNKGSDITQVSANRNVNGINNKYQAYVNEKTGSSTPGMSSQFRSFGSDIVRDIGQFAKWSIAVAAVYTPLKKLGELMAIMVDNESRLADATIAANIPFEKSGELFDTVSVSANQAGESINTTIDAYAQAIRAAGRYNTEQEKSQKGLALLNDSLILSKLSTLDQSDAIDTLSAALIQSDRELDQGQELLNKWVRVSQIANVGVDGLATGVAVLGDSAETAGLSIDQLNGLIAVLSENSISGSKEAANTAKALVGSYQSDKAEAALNRYGISLRKASGEVRGFLEIYQDLADQRQKGNLSEAAISEIASALGGGGSRRGAQAAALINSQDRLNKLAAESAEITGADSLANDSLAKKLETVETAQTRLGNSFQELAQTLGDDGGLLDIFKSMLNALTGITSASNELFSLLGRSGPVLTTFVASMVALNALGQNRRTTMIAGLGVANQGMYGISGQMDASLIRNGGGVGQFARGIGTDILSMNKRGGRVLGGAAVAAAGISNLAAGRNEQAVGNVVGGAIGAAIGGYLGGGPGIAIGATIGSSVGDSFVTALLSHSQDLKDYFAGVIPEPKDAATGTAAVENREKTTEEIIKESYKAIGGGNELIGSLNAFEAFVTNKIATTAGNKGENAAGSYATQEAAAIALLKEINPELYLELSKKNQIEKSQEKPIATSSEYLQLQKRAELERSKQLEKVSEGKTTSAEFGRISESLTGFPSRAIRGVDAFGEAFIALSDDVDSVSDAYNAFLELSVNGTADQISQLNSYVSDIEKLQAQWDNWSPGTKVLDLSTGTQAFNTKEDVGTALQNTQGQAAQYTQQALLNARLQQLKLPGIVGSATTATSSDDVNLIKREAEKLQEQFFTDMNLTNEEINHLRKGLEDFSVLVERSGQDHFDTITGIDQKFWDAAQKLLVEQGKLKEEKGIGFQKFDVPRAQLEQLAAQSLQIGQSWQEKFNYDFKPEDQIAIDSAGKPDIVHADFKILALLLEKIIDQNQKQLDGQYNIPEGATFWVPLTAAYYRNKGTEGGGDLQSMLDSLAVDNNTGATDQNTSAVTQLTRAMDAKVSRMDELDARTAEDNYKNTKEPYDRSKDDAMRGRGYEQDTSRGRSNERGSSRTLGETNPSPTFRDTGMMQLMAELRNTLLNLFNSATNNKYSGGGLGGGTTGGRPGSIGGRDTAVNTSPTTKLDLKVSSNINLMVDGRILAQTMQSYMASELLRTEQTQGTISRRMII